MLSDCCKNKKQKPTLLVKCTLCDSIKSRFIKEQEISLFLSNLKKHL